MSAQNKTEQLLSSREEMKATSAYSRLSKLFDDGIFTEIDAFSGSVGGYAEVAAGRGTVSGTGVYAFAQNSDVSGGAMSKAQAAKIKKVYELAVKTGAPVIALYDSIGGRLDEESDLLGAYGDVLRSSGNLSGVVPQISVVLGKCYGTQALIAVNGDILIMSEKAELSLATDGSGASANENAESGVAQIVAKDEDEAIAKARELMALLPANNLEYAGTVEFDASDEASDDLIKSVADGGSIIELQSDFGKCVRTVLATVEGTTVGIIKTEKKALCAAGCDKAARLVRFCDAFNIPVITLVDAEKFKCIKSAAKLTGAYAEATTPKISVITGDAYGAVYIAMAGTGAAADMTLAWADASVSALSPEAAAVIELGDDFGGALKNAADTKAEKAKIIADFKSERLTAMKAAEKGYVQDIILPEETRMKIIAALDMLSDKRVSTLPKKHNNLYI